MGIGFLGEGKMSYLFKITLTTELGSKPVQLRANSIQQVSHLVPESVLHYEASVMPLSGDDAVISDTELSSEFGQIVWAINSKTENS